MSKGMQALYKLVSHIETEAGSDDFYEVKNARDAVEKELKEHEKYKAIEQQLGIDLDTLFKALKDGIYIDEYNHGLMYSLIVPHLVHECGQYYFKYYGDFGSEDFGFDEYGKTWALTKEELK